MPIWNMQRRGPMLYYVCSKSGAVDEGAFDSAVGAIDLDLPPSDAPGSWITIHEPGEAET